MSKKYKSNRKMFVQKRTILLQQNNQFSECQKRKNLYRKFLVRKRYNLKKNKTDFLDVKINKSQEKILLKKTAIYLKNPGYLNVKKVHIGKHLG